MSFGSIELGQIDWTRQPPARSGRAGIEMPVDVHVGAHTKAAVTSNVSPYGAFVATRLLLRVGEFVTLAFAVPGYRVPIVVKAQVRWTRATAAPDAADQRPAGAGVRFVDPSIAASACLTALVQAHEAR